MTARRLDAAEEHWSVLGWGSQTDSRLHLLGKISITGCCCLVLPRTHDSHGSVSWVREVTAAVAAAVLVIG